MKKFISILLALCLILPYTALAQEPVSIFEEEDDHIYHWSADLLRYIAYLNIANNQPASLNPTALPSIMMTPTDPFYGNQWWPAVINAEDAWDISTGLGITIAVIDTGVDYLHPDLINNIWSNTGEVLDGTDTDGNGYIDDIMGWDFGESDNDPMAMYYHGTHVAGIIAADDNDIGVVGIAPDAEIMALKVYWENSYRDLNFWDKVAEAIRYAADMGARILSISLGSYFIVPALISAVQYAYDAGCIIVAAAGNARSQLGEWAADSLTPGNIDNVITVGATDSTDAIADFSNSGDTLDVAAPGEDIYSTYWPNPPLYDYMSGTSMATPLVSGLLALMLSNDPGLSNIEVMQKLRFSSVDLGAPGFDEYFGYGRIDALAALLSEDYYGSGYLWWEWLDTPDAYGNSGYKYYDENFGGIGYGRSYNIWTLDDVPIYNLGYLVDTAIELMQRDLGLSPLFGQGNSFYFYDEVLGSSTAATYQFNSGATLESNILSGTEEELTKAFYGDTTDNTAWFLWGDDVYGTYDNVVIEHTPPLYSTHSIGVGYAHDKIIMDPTGTYACLIGSSYALTRVDLSDNSFASFEAGYVNDLVFDSTGTYVYFLTVSTEFDGVSGDYLIKASAADGEIVDYARVCGPGFDPRSLALTSDENYAYVAIWNLDQVVKVNLTDFTTEAPILVGAAPEFIAINPTGTYALVSNYYGNSVSKIRLSDNAVTTIPTGEFSRPGHIAFDLTGTYAYVLNGLVGGITKINLATDETTSIAVGNGPKKMVIDPTGTYGYVINTGSNNVTKIDLSDDSTTTINVGLMPYDIVIDSTGTFAYVANRNSDTVTIIDLSDDSTQTINVGHLPEGIVIDPSGEYVYVVNDGATFDVTRIQLTGEVWNAYTFTPDTLNPENVANPDNWTFIEEITDPGNLVLPELGDWWQYCLNNNIIPEFPALSSEYFDDAPADGKIDSRVDQNDVMTTTYNYTWDYLVAGQMRVDMSYDYDGDSTDELVYSKVYRNDSDYDLANMDTWQLLSETYAVTGLEVTYEYYASGMRESRVCSQADQSGKVYYHYIDEDFGGQGYGRVDKAIRANPDTDGAIAYEYIYDGDTGTVLERRCYEDAFISGANPADLNDDGMVNMLDYGLFSNEWGWTGTPGDNTCDFNTDGIVNERDLDIFNAFWLMSQDPSPSDPIFANLVRTYTYYAESASRLESMTLRDPDEEGNIYYEYENNDFYGNGEHGRIIRTQRASDGHVIRTLSWVGNTDKVLKEEEFTDLTETEWLETRWYYKETGRIRARRENDGSVILYHDTDGDKKYIYWAPDGSISCWKTADDYDNDKKAWYMKDGLLEVYTYYDSGRIQFKDIYEVIDDMLTWKEAYGYLDSGDFPFGNTDGLKTIEETGADLYCSIQNKPRRSDSNILFLLSGETNFNHEEEVRMALEALLNQTYSQGSGYTFSPYLADQIESKYKK